MIVGICGSMRKNGNSEWMVDTILNSAKENGANTHKVALRALYIKFCTGCDACHNNGGNCIQKDGMTELYQLLMDADVIVVGSPNYFKNVSALMKNFIDRTNAFVRVRPRKLEGKYALGLSVGGEELEDTQYCEDALIRFFRGHKMKILSMVKARGDEIGALKNNAELKEKLIEIGKRLAMKDFENMTFFR